VDGAVTAPLPASIVKLVVEAAMEKVFDPAPQNSTLFKEFVPTYPVLLLKKSVPDVLQNFTVPELCIIVLPCKAMVLPTPPKVNSVDGKVTIPALNKLFAPIDDVAEFAPNVHEPPDPVKEKD